jgi:hypothetical protein
LSDLRGTSWLSPGISAHRRPWLDCRDALAFQNAWPVELNARIQFLDEARRFFIERSTTDLDTWRRPKPVENPRTRLPPPAFRMDDESVLVAPLVAIEPQVRQDLLPLLRRGRSSSR